MVNPRKAYPIDPGLISLYERTGRANLGHALETVVLLELERRGCEIDYVRTRDGYEVDFFARNPAGRVTLVRVSTQVKGHNSMNLKVGQRVPPARFSDGNPLGRGGRRDALP